MYARPFEFSRDTSICYCLDFIDLSSREMLSTCSSGSRQLGLGGRIHGERGARAYNGGLGAVPKPLVGVQRASPP